LYWGNGYAEAEVEILYNPYQGLKLKT